MEDPPPTYIPRLASCVSVTVSKKVSGKGEYLYGWTKESEFGPHRVPRTIRRACGVLPCLRDVIMGGRG